MNKKRANIYCSLMEKIFDDIDKLAMSVSNEVIEENFIKNKMVTLLEYKSIGFEVLNNIKREIYNEGEIT